MTKISLPTILAKGIKKALIVGKVAPVEYTFAYFPRKTKE